MRNITSIVKPIRDIMRKDAGLDGVQYIPCNQLINYELFSKKYKYYFQFCKFGVIIILIAFIFHKWNDKRN